MLSSYGSILVIDPDQINQARIAAAAKVYAPGKKVLRAAGIQECVNVLDTRVVDCVVVDTSAADSGGFEFLTFLKQRYPHVHLTATFSPHDEVRGIRRKLFAYGADNVCAKHEIDLGFKQCSAGLGDPARTLYKWLARIFR